MEKQNWHIQQLFTKVPLIAEQIIIGLPPKINKVRTMDLYPIDEAYKILRQIAAISCNFGHHIFSQEARECLRNAIGELSSKAQF